jgi:hypothetical protein
LLKTAGWVNAQQVLFACPYLFIGALSVFAGVSGSLIVFSILVFLDDA